MPEIAAGGGRDSVRESLLRRHGWDGAVRSALKADASFRRYVRLRRGRESVLLMDAPPPHEDVRPFVRIARHLVAVGLSAPRILDQDEAYGFLLIEDFGDDTFTRLLAAGAEEEPLYRLALDVLIHVHRLPSEDAAPAGTPRYDAGRLMAEARLLPDWFVPAVNGGREFDRKVLAEFEAVWRETFALLEGEPATLVLRDFHVDNLMRVPGRSGVAACGILDFQDAVMGPPAYDLMSLLEDARRDVPEDMGRRLFADYVAAIPRLADDGERARFERSYAILAAQRHAKVIGIFTRLARRDGKPVYLPHVPRVWRMLERALASSALAPVAAWFDRYVPKTLRRSP